VFPKPIIEYMYEGGCEWSHPEVIGHMGVEYNPLGEVTTVRTTWGVSQVCAWEANKELRSWCSERKAKSGA
jgi:hypothetical protein